MLSLPTVSDMNVASTSWQAGFVDYLESSGLGVDGYRVPVGSASQLTTLSWLNLNQIRITFSEQVDVQAADLSISGVSRTAYEFSGFQLDSATNTAIWTLRDPIANDRVLLDLDADGIDPVQDVDEGNILDGEWTDSSDTYPSGNGSAGGDFQFRINFLAGDTNASNGVNMSDAMPVGYNIGKTAGQAGYNIRHDVDGSGAIELSDYSSVQACVGSVLVSGTPAGMTNDAPTTAGIANVNVNEDAANVQIDLFAVFQDAENSDGALTYQVLANTNPSLFDSCSIDSTQGTLTLDLASNANGTASLTVRATDTGGLIVETTFDVNVAAVNDAPVRTAGTVAALVVERNSSATSLGLDTVDYGAGGGADEATQTITYQVAEVPAASLGSVVLADGTTVVTTGTTYTLTEIRGMKFQPVTDVSGSGLFRFTATDNGTTAGQSDPQAVTESMEITVNAPPVILTFGGSHGLGDFWTFQGTVTDPDDNMAGQTVVFGGVLAGYGLTAIIQADGTFSVTAQLPNIQTGVATARTEDPHGLLSNLATCEVWVS